MVVIGPGRYSQTKMLHQLKRLKCSPDRTIWRHFQSIPPMTTFTAELFRIVHIRWGIGLSSLCRLSLGMILFGCFFGGGVWAGQEEDASGRTPEQKEEVAEGWTIECPKDGDRLKITPQKEGVVLEIYSHRGIGQATVERTTAPWPKPVLLRLHLRGLESLRVQAGPWGFEASVMSYPPYQTRLRVHGPEPFTPVDPKSPYWVEIRMVDSAGKPASKIPLEGGCFEVRIPPALLEKAPQKMQIHWIDFFRD